MSSGIYITKLDKEKLEQIIDEEIFTCVKEEKLFRNLEKELNKAILISPQDLPENIITMDSKAIIQLDGEEMEISLVYPQDSDWESNKLSIFSPIGTALIGYKEGDTVEWELPNGEKTKIYIKKVLFQPEAAEKLA